MIRFACSAAALLLAGLAPALAQQDVVADPTHHKLIFENDCVRVVRAIFPPHEKSDGMFDTKSVVVVTLATGTGWVVSFPDGKSVEPPPSAPGSAVWVPGGARIGLENTGDSRIEYLVIEPKPGCNN
jgi:hypothetical protein